MHTVVAELCTGCELCIAPCPVDCITMVPRSDLADAPPAPEPPTNRERFDAHNERLARRARERDALLAARKQMAGPSTRRYSDDTPMHPATRRAIFRRLQAANPDPTTELALDPVRAAGRGDALRAHHRQERQRRDPQALSRRQYPRGDRWRSAWRA